MAVPAQVVGPEHAVELLGVKLVGVNAETLKKLLFSIALVAVLWLVRWMLAHAIRLVRTHSYRFWSRQGINIVIAVICVIGLVSIWVDNPAHLGTAGALLTAGLAFALQKVITSFAGYLLILRGKIFNVGDRIRMGGVRGDVIGLGFLQTRIMEMGQPPEEGEQASVWVQSRQYTGRIVVVSNDKLFDEPVYNYTHDFPFIWEEIRIPVPYSADRRRAEQILLEAARTHTLEAAQLGEEALRDFERRYFTQRSEIAPRVYYRLTANWLELAVRFIAEVHGVRELKDAMARDILDHFGEAGISVASSTYDVVGLPPLRVTLAGGDDDARAAGDGATPPTH